MKENFSRVNVIDLSNYPEAAMKLDTVLRELFGGCTCPMEGVREYRPSIFINPNDLLGLACNTLGMDCKQSTINFLRHLNNQNAGAVLNILLRIVAVEIDKMYYNNHISDEEVVYIFNTLNGKFQELSTEEIKNKKTWKYFAAFRTLEQGVNAIKLIHQFKEAYLSE